MKGWIVFRAYDYEGGTIVGIFADERKARNRFEKLEQEKYNEGSQHIEEFTFDKEIGISI